MSVYKRHVGGRDVWEVKIYVGGRGGRQVVRRPSINTRGAARELEAELLKRREFLPEKRDYREFDKLFSAFLNQYEPSVSPSSYERVEAVSRLHVSPVLGRLLVHKYSHKDADELIGLLQERGLSTNAINKSVSFCKMVGEYGVRCSVFAENPFRFIKKLSEQSGEVIIPSEEWVTKALGLVPGEHKGLFVVLAYGGLRFNEAIALETSDTTGGFLSVSKAYNRHIGGVGSTKTHRSRRVPMLGIVKEYLPTPKSGLLFPSKNGGYMNITNWRRRVFEKHLGSEYRIHDLRHFYASIMIEHGANIMHVARWMGHSTPTITLNTYAHLMDAAGTDVLDSIDKQIGTK